MGVFSNDEEEPISSIIQGVEVPDIVGDESGTPEANTTEVTPVSPIVEGVQIPDFDENGQMSSPEVEDERSTFQAFKEGSKAGAQEAIAPFSMSADDRTKALGHSNAALAGYIVSNLGAGFTAGSAAGSVIPGLGTALGAGAGTVRALATIGPALYAVYAGLGRDRLRSQEAGEEWDPISGKGIATAALTIGTELNPLIKASSMPAAIIRGAAQVGGEALTEALHGGDKKSVAMAGVFATLGAASIASRVAGKGKIAESLVGESAENIGEALADNSRGYMSKAMAALKDEDLHMPREADKVPSEFKRYVLADAKAQLDGKQLDDAFNSAASKLTPEKLDDTYAMFKTQGVLTRIVEEDTAALNKGISSAPTLKDITKADQWLNPTLYVARAVDGATGLEVGQLYDKMNQTRHAFSNVSNTFAQDLYKVRRAADKLGLSGEDVFALIERKPTEGLTKAIAKHGQANIDVLRQDVVKHTDKLFGFLKELGYSPERRLDYMPHKAKNAVKLAVEVDDITDELKQSMAKEGLRTIDDIRLKPDSVSASHLDLLDSLAQRRIGQPIKEGGDIAKLKTALLSSKGQIGSTEELDKDISALFARKGEIAGRIQERNAWELLSGYVNENVRAAMYDDALKYGQTMVRALEVGGMPKASQFFKRYLADNMGNKWGLDGAMKNLRNQMEYKGTKMARDTTMNIFGRTAGKAVAELPEFAAWLNNQIYPAKLAFNVPGMIRNYTQFLMSTAPEVGGIYGSRLAVSSGLDTIKLSAANPGKLKSFLASKNLASEFFKGELENTATGVGRAKHYTDAMNEKMMTFYGASDTVNRIISYKMGQQIAKDLLAGNPDAAKFMKKADAGLKSVVKRAMLEGKGESAAENMGDAIGRYLISKTQFDFGKAAQSEMQRAVGPAFSMFTTWPINIAADVANTYREQGMKSGSAQVLRKYFAAYLMLAGASAWMEEHQNPLVQYLIGKPEEFAPIASILPKQSQGRSLASNPLVDTIGKTLAPLTSSDLSVKDRLKGSARNAISAAATSYTPIVAPVINEVQKFQRAFGKETIMQRAYNKLHLNKDE